jgi:CheY-like chemotaxis protein
MDGMLRRLIGEDIIVTTRLSSEIGEVYVDPNQMEQVILNLVVNARDAMPRGGELTIKTAVADVDQHAAAVYDADLEVGRYAVLSITDTGHGMDQATRDRIFEPFFTTKQVGQGTGLGLSTVYGIVKQSGGAIVVESDVGRGTTFVIFLPFLQRDEEAQADTAIPAPPARGSETILLVEDDPSVRAVIRLTLQRGGYTVVEAASGVQAIRMAEEWGGSFDLVLSDVVMPGMSGHDVVEALWKRLPGVPALFMSGYTDDAIQQHGVLEPGTFFLEKPFTPDALSRKVREVLDGRKV